MPLENQITVLEHDILVLQGKVTLLQDQSKAKQDTIDILQAEIALLKSKPSSEYTQSSFTKQQMAPPKSYIPWPLSLCFSAPPPSDEYDFDPTLEDNSEVHAQGPYDHRPFSQRPSMILDGKDFLRYSTSAQVMSTQKDSLAPPSTSDAPAPPPLSDLERLMMNGPILVRPGRPLAYVDDNGQIVEVECDIEDLPPMM